MSNWPNNQPDSEDKKISQEYYISWAQKAYKHIQEEKAIEQSDTSQVNTIETIDSLSINTSTSDKSLKKNIPTWMQKSNRLDALKENATESKAYNNETSVDLNKEFVWSAKILANQGRDPEDVTKDEIQWLTRLHQGLGKTRRGLLNKLKFVLGQGPLNDDVVAEIEAILLQADIGINATDYIITSLQDKLLEESLPSEQAIEYLKNILCDILNSPLKKVQNSEILVKKEVLNIWLLTGVNGAGKTTTIGKLAYLAQQLGHSCIIAAADTFRAAAVEQVRLWGEKTNTPVIANPGKNTDPAAVVYDGLIAAQARGVDLLLIDTAGRLQNKTNLMEELAKIRRVIDKKAENAHVESLLVIDATLGQNGLRQTELFLEAAHLSGVILTKLDGTSKGGIAIAIAQQFGLPIRFIGVGEDIQDLKPFSSYEFVEALLNE
ncbi:signal recognition particle-docking protein FtsY [Candidatus Atelocyanobacterium thalassae]|uniref:Signal recognition particle receptor FtsY n=1 Tax=cyanobacterium endosymbiont of Braarudosphaera bigelowii TaxID=1285375 RepID=A0ABN6K0L2_9CHRO|nr:signal recognition particle-docking protein FtsY [Candidatus Atelocyanobacterium thalassa]BDA40290.1 signal recognition particle receptor FtsY [cyanobacterium endosymbiont of Braarudosphaera bigelowii]